MKKIAIKIVVVTLSFVPIVSSAQITKQDSIWLPMKVFIGNWSGPSEGEPGKGNSERSYQFVLNKKYIEIKNKSVYPPAGENKKEQTHEDIGYISYDRMRKLFVFRQFHIEGFVNEYKLESILPDSKSLVFISENIENIPAGWRARETYRIINEDEFTETFELSEPGKDFSIYSSATFKRRK